MAEKKSGIELGWVQKDSCDSPAQPGACEEARETKRKNTATPLPWSPQERFSLTHSPTVSFFPLLSLNSFFWFITFLSTFSQFPHYHWTFCSLFNIYEPSSGHVAIISWPSSTFLLKANMYRHMSTDVRTQAGLGCVKLGTACLLKDRAI